jgi:hypothetical protein
MLPWACRRPRAGSYSQVAIVAASVQPHIAYGSGAESLTRSKSGLHYLRWQTSISAVKISQSGQLRTFPSWVSSHRRKAGGQNHRKTAMAKLAKMV